MRTHQSRKTVHCLSPQQKRNPHSNKSPRELEVILCETAVLQIFFAMCCEFVLKVVGSLQSKSTRRVVETATRLFIPNESSKFHSRLHNMHTIDLKITAWPPSHLLKQGLCQIYTRPLSHFNKHGLRQHATSVTRPPPNFTRTHSKTYLTLNLL